MSKAVIFDVDGVLVDSYEAHFESWLVLAEDSGLTFTEDEFASVFGRTSVDIIRTFWPEDELDAARLMALDDRKESLYRNIVSARFPAMDGAVELIDWLSEAGFDLAVGSSGPPENVNLVLGHLDRQNVFDAVVTGVDVTRGKPDPQVFLTAASRLGADPADSVVIEDAPAGIEAAHSAGMKAIGLASTGRTTEELSQADLVVGSLRDIILERVLTLLGKSEQ